MVCNKLTKQKKSLYHKISMKNLELLNHYKESLLQFLSNGKKSKGKIGPFLHLSIEELSSLHFSALSSIIKENKTYDPSEVIERSGGFLKRLIAAKEKDTGIIKRLSGVSGFLSSSLKSDELLNAIMEKALTELKGETGSLMLLDKNKKELSIKASVGLSEDIIKTTKTKLGEKIAGKVAQTGKPLLFNKKGKEREIKSALCVPLSINDEIIGVLSINRLKNIAPFTKYDLSVLSFLANLAAAAIVHANLTAEIKAGYLATVKTLIAAMEAKDHYTRGHSEAVARYATAIAKEFHLDEEEVERIYIAGLLHDIGKIGIKEEILLKPGRLTNEEFEAIKEHPLIGTKILEPASFHKDVITSVSHHHERPDGKGYPYGYKDENIYIGAAIINVADAFDAMTSERPYRSALSIEEAAEELKKNSGTQFNKEVVDKFLIILKKKGVIK